MKICCGVGQLVGRRVHNPDVAGSSPAPVTKEIWGFMPYKYKKIKVNGKAVDEHRHIMEVYLGRNLGRKEVVHHKDEDTRNNDISNLELTDYKSHNRFHGHTERLLSGSYEHVKENSRFRLEKGDLPALARFRPLAFLP